MNALAWKKLFAPGSISGGAREKVLTTPAGKIWTARHGSGSGLPLVVVHGGPGFPHDYLLTLKDLGADRLIIFYDQLGCGRSPGSAPTGGWSAEYFIEELAAVIAALSPQGAHVLGHSWGALVAVEAALAGAPIRSLVLASPFLSAKHWCSDAAERRASLPCELQAALREGEERRDATSEEYLRATAEYYRRFVYGGHRFEELIDAAAEGASDDVYQALWGPNEFVVRGALKEYEIGARLGEIAVPVLYTAGRNDEVLPETLEQFARETRGAEAKIFELSAHHPHLSEAREYCAAIKVFLDNAEGEGWRTET